MSKVRVGAQPITHSQADMRHDVSAETSRVSARQDHQATQQDPLVVWPTSLLRAVKQGKHNTMPLLVPPWSMITTHLVVGDDLNTVILPHTDATAHQDTGQAGRTAGRVGPCGDMHASRRMQTFFSKSPRGTATGPAARYADGCYWSTRRFHGWRVTGSSTQRRRCWANSCAFAARLLHKLHS